MDVITDDIHDSEVLQSLRNARIDSGPPERHNSVITLKTLGEKK
jgi:hypothetical protein